MLHSAVHLIPAVGIIVAYLVKVGRRDVLPKLWIAVIVAAAIPLALGILWTWGPSTITFQTQEILGGVFSIIAVGFITWMIFWTGKKPDGTIAESKPASVDELAGELVDEHGAPADAPRDKEAAPTKEEAAPTKD